MGLSQRLASAKTAVRCLLRKPSTDAYLITLQQSGTHWLRMLLVQYLKNHYEIDYDITDLDLTDFICHPRTDPDIDLREAPTLRSTHHAYWFLYRNESVILLVRNLRKTLLSAYEKMIRINDHPLDFEEFIKGDFDPQKYEYVTRDLPHRVRFLNRWYRYGFEKAHVHLVKFEDLKNDPPGIVREVLHFLDVPINETELKRAVKHSSKEAMRELAKNSSRNRRKAISDKDGRDPKSFFTPSTERYFLNYLEENLEHDYGYNYEPEILD